LIYKAFLPVGLRAADISMQQKEPNLIWRCLYFIAYQVVFRQLRDRLGMKNVKVAYSAGGTLSSEIVRYFKALGIEIKLGYGTTEIGMVSMPRTGEIRPETSGRIVPWADVKISEDGEIIVKSKYMYSEYYKNPKDSQKNFKNGWYCTGDFGYLDDKGHLIVIDRMDDLKPLAGGKKFSPQYAESRLRFSPFIKDILVVGNEQRTFVVSLVNIDIENVGRYAEAHQIPYTTFTDLSQKSEVINLIKREIEKINRTLPEHARIKRFVNLQKEFDADEAELTRTRKLRRSYIEQRYSNLIDGLYSDDHELAVETPITYRDGKTRVIKTSIKINSLDR
jgi:long-chain acyl-CoA synthetase